MNFLKMRALLIAVIALFTLSVAGVAVAAKNAFPPDIVKEGNTMEWDADKYEAMLKAFKGDDSLIIQHKNNKSAVGVTCVCSGEASGTCSMTIKNNQATCGGDACCGLVTMTNAEVSGALGGKKVRGR